MLKKTTNLSITPDNIISKDEIEAITLLNLNDANISDLSGIEDFINLETLWCYKNNLSILDISQNLKLKLLDCRWNNIHYLNIGNPTLEEIYCSSNSLQNLDLSRVLSLVKIDCDENKLENLDV